MLILITYQTAKAINYRIYKLYQKKPSLQIEGKISDTYSKPIWEQSNSQAKLIDRITLDHLDQNQATDHDRLTQIVSHPNLSAYSFDIVIHKIAHGGDEYNGITLLSKQNLAKLWQLASLAPQQQAADLSLTEVLINYYPTAKHYGCFDTSFHQTIDLNYRMLVPDWDYLRVGIKNYGCHGLIFAALTAKLPTLADKKIAKGRWIIAYLSQDETTLCAIKNNKSIHCTSSSLHHELVSGQHCGKIDPRLIGLIAKNRQKDLVSEYNMFTQCNLLSANNSEISNYDMLFNSQTPTAKLGREYYLTKLAESFTGLVNSMQGVDGVIFTGEEGTTNSKLRELICIKLSWLGLELSNKANLDNACRLHKKTSSISIFALSAEPFSAMLNHLFERI